MTCKSFLTLLALSSAISAAAQSTTSMIVGYCSDDSDGAIGMSEKGLNIGAVKFEGDFLQQYAGNQVTAVVLQLGASFGSAGSIFLTDQLTEPVPERFDAEYDIPDFDIVPCYKWLEIPLEHPFTIDPDRPFYTGLRILPYTQEPYYGTYQFAVDENPAGAAHCYIYDEAKQKWGPLSNYTFEDYEAPNFLIKLRLEGNALPMNDVSVADLQCVDYMRTTESCSCSFNITNLASNDVNELDADLLLDGVLSQSHHINQETALKTGDVTTCSFDDIQFEGEGTHTVAVRVTHINGVADTHPENNTEECEVSVIDRYFDHTVLVEAFTTMSCANCPNAHERQDKAFEGVTNVVRVDHHSGFGTDVLTTQADRDFLWFYNNGGTTYAPGMMFDRAMIDDFFDPQRSPGEEHSPIVGPGDPENILFIHNHLAARPAYVNVNLDATYNQTTRKLNITVSGEAIAKLQGDNATINVWLTESGLSAAEDRRLGQMTSSGNPDMNFVHNHTLRTSLTGSWGKPISIGLADYSQSFETTLDKGWRAENMDIVAFIANYDNEHPDNCLVHNCASLPISTLMGGNDGIVAIESTSKPFAPVYDLTGRKTTATKQGVTICNGHKYIR